MPNALPDLVLVERSTRPVPSDVFREIEIETTLRPLLDAGVIALTRSRSTPFGISCGPWVGRVRLPNGRSLIIDEKVSGSLMGLLRIVAPQSIRTVDLESTTSRNLDAYEVVIGRFVASVDAYVATGREVIYEERRDVSSHPRGRIDIHRTMRARTHGRNTQVAYAYPALTRSTPANEIIALGLFAAEHYLAGRRLQENLLLRLRSLVQTFADCDAMSWRRRPATALARAQAEAVAAVANRGPLRDALLYARVILLGLGPWHGTIDAVVPQGLFVSLEKLFEEAVLATTQLVSALRATKGAELGVPLLDATTGRYIVDPDVVVGSMGAVRGVFDVKYKDAAGWPDHSDVYQLAAHASALRCEHAVLIYPGATCEERVLGRTASGVQIIAAVVRIPSLANDLRTVIRHIGAPVIQTEAEPIPV